VFMYYSLLVSPLSSVILGSAVYLVMEASCILLYRIWVVLLMYFALYVCCCLYPSCLVGDIIFFILVVLSSYVCGFVCIPIFFVVLYGLECRTSAGVWMYIYIYIFYILY
jgi:hypothetical protein